MQIFSLNNFGFALWIHFVFRIALYKAVFYSLNIMCFSCFVPFYMRVHIVALNVFVQANLRALIRLIRGQVLPAAQTFSFGTKLRKHPVMLMIRVLMVCS